MYADMEFWTEVRRRVLTNELSKRVLLPGTLAIVTDAFGILVIGVSSIALMKKVAIFGAFWALSIVVTEMLLNRLLIVYFPAPKNFSHYTPGNISKITKIDMGKVRRLWLTPARHAATLSGRRAQRSHGLGQDLYLRTTGRNVSSGSRIPSIADAD